MAELTTCRNDVLGYPVYGLPYVVVAPLLDADGDPVLGATPDTEISKNGDTSADTATEASEITATTAGNGGNYALPLSAAEMTCDVAAIVIASATSKATSIVLYPKKLPLLVSGTAGATGNDTTHIHLDGLSAINSYYKGCLLFLKDHTGANQVRLIKDYVGATELGEVSPAFATAPDNTTDYEIYLTDLALPTLITNLVWDVVRSLHPTAGTYGEVSTAAELVTAILAGVVDGTGGNAIALSAAVAQILALASGNVTKTGDAYAFKDRDGATLFTLTMAAGSRTRS